MILRMGAVRGLAVLLLPGLSLLAAGACAATVHFSAPLQFFYALDGDGYILPVFETLYRNGLDRVRLPPPPGAGEPVERLAARVEYHRLSAEFFTLLAEETSAMALVRYELGISTARTPELARAARLYYGLELFQRGDWTRSVELLGPLTGDPFVPRAALYLLAARRRLGDDGGAANGELRERLAAAALGDAEIYLEWSYLHERGWLPAPPPQEAPPREPQIGPASSPAAYWRALARAVLAGDVGRARELLRRGPSLSRPAEEHAGGVLFPEPGLLVWAARAHRLVELASLEQLVSSGGLSPELESAARIRIAVGAFELQAWPRGLAALQGLPGEPADYLRRELELWAGGGATPHAIPDDAPWLVWWVRARELLRQGRAQDALWAGRQAYRRALRVTQQAADWERDRARQRSARPALRALIAAGKLGEANQMANSLLAGGEGRTAESNDLGFLLLWARIKRLQGQVGYPKAMGCYTEILRSSAATRALVEHFRVVYASMATYLESGQIK